MRDNKTHIFTIYLHGFNAVIDSIIGKLNSHLPDIEFIGHCLLKGILDEKGKSKIFKEIENQRENIDGILVFGGILDHRITSFDLPVIMVRGLWVPGDWQKGTLNYYGNEKIITASLSAVDISQEDSEIRYQDLISKLKLIRTIKKLKKSKLLLVQEKKVLGQYDIFGMDYHVPLPTDYVSQYSENLKELQLNIEHMDLNTLLSQIPNIDINEARKIREKWISDAVNLNQETNEEQVMQAAKLYIAMKNLIVKYKASGIAIRSLVPWSDGTLPVTPCLPNTELNRQLKVGVCEGLVNSAVTELLGLYLFRRPSFIGDVIGIDTLHNVVTFAHCQCPVNPHGDDLMPYEIRSHALQRKNKMLPDYFPEIGKSLSAAVRVELPLNEMVTIVKLSIYHKKIALSSGETVQGERYYREYNDRLCRTKAAVRLNTMAFEMNYDTVTFGVHRNIIFGDYRKEFKQLATLMGYQVIEEDHLN